MPGNVDAFEGCCHCGAIGFVYRTSLRPAAWAVRACQCSFCRAHGARTTSDPRGTVEFRVSDPGLLNRYRFGTGAADFLLCRHCGTYLAALIETPAGCFATINVNALHPSPTETPAAEPVSYDGETAGERQVRRERRWTPAKVAA